MLKKVVNSLRFGLVPDQYLRYVTIGYDDYEKYFAEISESPYTMHFAMGYYGSGKSHFLHCINTIAQENGYATATVETDSVGQVSLAKPKNFFAETWYNVSLGKHKQTLSFTELICEFIDKMKINGIEDLCRQAGIDPNRFLGIYQAVMMLRNTNSFYNELELLDSIFIGDDDYTVKYACDELYEIFRDEGFTKKFFRKRIKAIVGNTAASAQELVSALFMLAVILRLLGSKGLFVIVDEFIFDCDPQKQEKVRAALRAIENAVNFKDLGIKFVFGVASNNDLRFSAGTTLQGFLYNQNVHLVKTTNARQREQLGEKLVDIYKLTYGINEEINKSFINMLLKAAESGCDTDKGVIRSFIKNVIYILDRKYSPYYTFDKAAPKTNVISCN